MAISKSNVIDLKAFSRSIRAKRATSVRNVAPVIGVSYSTINRLEHGMLPDLDTYAIVCRWLCVSLDTFVMGPVSASVAERLEWLEARVTSLEGTIHA